MQRTLSNERFKAFLEGVRKYYTWDLILDQFGLGKGSLKGDQYEITCPFHEDKRPSLRLDKRTGIYHCFSCQRKGYYTRFIWEMNGCNGSYVDFCEQILKSHPSLQEDLRFTSLFVTEDTLDPRFNQRRVFDRKSIANQQMPITIFCKRARDIDDSWSNLVLSFTLLQQGIATNDILTFIKKNRIVTEKPAEKVSVMDIFGDES